MAQESWKREEEAGCQPPEGPILCTNNCGFFGSVTTMNMCSKCYRELIILKQSKAASSGIDMASFKKAGMDSIPNSRISPPSSPPGKVTIPTIPSVPGLPDGATKVTSPKVSSEGSNDTKDVEVPQETIVKLESTVVKVESSPPQALIPKKIPSATGDVVQVEPVISASASQDGKRPPPNRCFSCRKRVGLTGFKCRCGDIFCSLHRYSDKHNCTYDYKAAGREAIAKANPVVKADKVEKI